jgi:nucleotide-binding universal stress UspA family protein
VAAEILKSAPCPVLTMANLRRGRAAGGVGDGVVCAVALDDSSPRTVAYAAELARATGGRLTLLHVRPPCAAGEAESARRLHALAGPAAELAPGGVEEAIADGDPGGQIVRAAARRQARLVVIGAGAGRAPGAVAERVIRAAPCAVVTVRAPRMGSP